MLFLMHKMSNGLTPFYHLGHPSLKFTCRENSLLSTHVPQISYSSYQPFIIFSLHISQRAINLFVCLLFHIFPLSRCKLHKNGWKQCLFCFPLHLTRVPGRGSHPYLFGSFYHFPAYFHWECSHIHQPALASLFWGLPRLLKSNLDCLHENTES